MTKAIPRLSQWLGRMIPEGRWGRGLLGHRRYVGGMWDIIGPLQLAFMVEQGLEPRHCLLDIACGSLRGGAHFIRYLEPGNYLGLDKDAGLIEAGVAKELEAGLPDEKGPEFVVSDAFEFSRFSKQPDYSIAQSLFTHIRSEAILLCLGNLRRFVEAGHTCYATFFESGSVIEPDYSHSFSLAAYPVSEMQRFGEENGWRFTYIGAWGHPRGQTMVRYTAA